MLKPAVVLLSVLITLYILRCQRNKNLVFNTKTDTQIAETISVQEAKKLIDENVGNDKFVILDVRSSGEFASGQIENAVNVNVNASNFKSTLESWDRNNIYLIYCRSGNRSRTAMNIMIDMEFQTLYNMSGGIIAWQNASYPVITD